MSARTGDPNKASKNGTATSMTAPEAKTEAPAEPVAEANAEAPVEEAKAEAPVEDAKGEGNASDILAMIRARQNQ